MSHLYWEWGTGGGSKGGEELPSTSCRGSQVDRHEGKDVALWENGGTCSMRRGCTRDMGLTVQGLSYVPEVQSDVISALCSRALDSTVEWQRREKPVQKHLIIFHVLMEPIKILQILTLWKYRKSEAQLILLYTNSRDTVWLDALCVQQSSYFLFSIAHCEITLSNMCLQDLFRSALISGTYREVRCACVFTMLWVKQYSHFCSVALLFGWQGWFLVHTQV